MPDDAAPAPSSTLDEHSAHPSLVVPARFCGPPQSGNGGYVASRVASHLGVTAPADTAPHGIEPRAVTTVLRAPIPLETPLDVVVDGPTVTVWQDGAVLAEATPGELTIDPPDPVSYEDAVRAGERYPGYATHPMPTCFGCGMERTAGDGLRLAVGALGDGRVAAAWRPDTSLLPAGASDEEIAAEFAWTVLDCTSAWAWDFPGEPALLGTMTGIVDEAPYAGDSCVAVASVVSREGRKIHTVSSLYDADGRVLGRAQSVWITVPAARFTP